jgi:hypothetical protein
MLTLMKDILIHFLCVAVALTHAASIKRSGTTSCATNYNGTTPDLESIFKGRCSYFINVLHKDDCNIAQSNLDCNQMWAEFSSVVLNKNPCDITLRSYDRLFNLSYHPIRPDTSMFWSGTNNPAHESKHF